MKRSVAECKQRGIEWLFHVDDDELLYFDEPFSRIVETLAPGVGCVVLVNIEAVPKALSADCVFEVSRCRRLGDTSRWADELRHTTTMRTRSSPHAPPRAPTSAEPSI